jgi:chromosome segregation ATPase
VTNTENLQDALNAAKENISTLALERDRLKLDLQRLRERSSVEMAEAKVAEARLMRVNENLAMRVSRLEAEASHLRLEVDYCRAAKRDLVQALSQLVNAHDTDDPIKTPGA